MKISLKQCRRKIGSLAEKIAIDILIKEGYSVRRPLYGDTGGGDILLFKNEKIGEQYDKLCKRVRTLRHNLPTRVISKEELEKRDSPSIKERRMDKRNIGMKDGVWVEYLGYDEARRKIDKELSEFVKQFGRRIEVKSRLAVFPYIKSVLSKKQKELKKYDIILRMKLNENDWREGFGHEKDLVEIARFFENESSIKSMKIPYSECLEEISFLGEKIAIAILKKEGFGPRRALGEEELRGLESESTKKESTITLPYRLPIEKSYNQYTISGLANFNMTDIPQIKESFKMDDEDNYFVLQILKSLIEKSDSALVSFELKKKKEEEEDA